MNKRPLSLASSSSSGSILANNNNHHHQSATTSPSATNVAPTARMLTKQQRKKFQPEKSPMSLNKSHDNHDLNNNRESTNLSKMKKCSSDGSLDLDPSSSSSSTSSLSFDKSVIINKFLSNWNLLDNSEFNFSFESVDKNVQMGSIADLIESKNSAEKRDYLLKIIEELLDTESNYVQDLQNIIKEYKVPIMSGKEYGSMNKNCDSIFGNIEELLQFNRSFLDQLNSCNLDPCKLSTTFIENKQGFYLYATYCANYPTSLELIKKCMKNTSVSSRVYEMQKRLKHRLPLMSYLLKPVQRISKYHLFLQNIKSCCLENKRELLSIDEAIQSMNTVLHHINQANQSTLSFKRNNNNNNNDDINSNNNSNNSNNNKPSEVGDLMLKEKFFVQSRSNKRDVLYLFLFSKSILVARKKSNDKYLVKILFKTSDVLLIERVQHSPLSFILVSIQDPTQYLKLEAKSENNKFHCCHQLKKVVKSDSKNLNDGLIFHINKIIQAENSQSLINQNNNSSKNLPPPPPPTTTSTKFQPTYRRLTEPTPSPTSIQHQQQHPNNSTFSNDITKNRYSLNITPTNNNYPHHMTSLSSSSPPQPPPTTNSPLSRSNLKRRSFINCNEGLGDRILNSTPNSKNTNYLFTLKIPKSKKNLKEKLNLSGYKEVKCDDVCVEGCSGVYKRLGDDISTSDFRISNNFGNEYNDNDYNYNKKNYEKIGPDKIGDRGGDYTNNSNFNHNRNNNKVNNNNKLQSASYTSLGSDSSIGTNNKNNNHNNNNNINDNNNDSSDDNDTSHCETFDFYYENKLLDDLEGISVVHCEEDEDDDGGADDDGENVGDDADAKKSSLFNISDSSSLNNSEDSKNDFSAICQDGSPGM